MVVDDQESTVPKTYGLDLFKDLQPMLPGGVLQPELDPSTSAFARLLYLVGNASFAPLMGDEL